mmetsp:Transcript_54525/g.126945  ORF Transcript_54525/g.126945 Transcript_54525/m.126945 type:complete len:261 (-) Transcript_54525:389-1171(-)
MKPSCRKLFVQDYADKECEGGTACEVAHAVHTAFNSASNAKRSACCERSCCTNTGSKALARKPPAPWPNIWLRDHWSAPPCLRFPRWRLFAENAAMAPAVGSPTGLPSPEPPRCNVRIDAVRAEGNQKAAHPPRPSRHRARAVKGLPRLKRASSKGSCNCERHLVLEHPQGAASRSQRKRNSTEAQTLCENELASATSRRLPRNMTSTASTPRWAELTACTRASLTGLRSMLRERVPRPAKRTGNSAEPPLSLQACTTIL